MLLHVKCLWSRPLQRFCSIKSTSKVLERKIRFKNQPDLHVVQAGHIGPNDLPSREHTVIMIPGIMGTAWTDFRLQLEHLPNLLPPDWSVISFDPPGRGQSKPPHELMPLDGVKRFGDAACDILDALSVDKFSILGWSGGAASAMQMAAERPEQVEKLVLLAGFPHITDSFLAYFESECLKMYKL